MGSSTDQYPVAAPFIVSPTFEFDGDDGNWSTFALEVGTPTQSFRVLPATLGQEVWLPVPQGCQGPLSGLSNCGTLRGANDFQNAPSQGFATGESSTWSGIGASIFVLSTEQNLFSADNGLYGQDTVSLGSVSGGAYSAGLPNQVVAGIATEDFWLGSLGLGTAPGGFPGHSASIPSLLVSLKSQNLSTSLSFGYTAGQHYAYPPLPGSLIFGGYDRARINSNAVSLPINASAKPQTLDLTIQSIVASNTLGGSTVSLLDSPITANIDSATSQLWLPDSACQVAADAFGLIYDSNTELFLINSTTHKQLQANNPSVVFTVGGGDGGPSTTIQMHYNAFDLNVGIPLYNSSTPYFPIRRAANASQYTLGRTFLQEAYIIVDWEQSNLTIGQAVAQDKTTDVVPLLPPTASQSTTANSTSHSSASATASSASSSTLQAGAIAGIVVAMIIILAALAGFGWFFLRRRRRNAKRQVEHGTAGSEGGAPEVSFGVVEHYPDEKKDGWHSSEVQVSEMPLSSSEMEAMPNEFYHKPLELANTQVHELPAGVAPIVDRELMGTPVMELEGNLVGSELDVSNTDLTSSRPPLGHRESDGTVSLISPPESRPQSPNARSSILSGTTVGETRELRESIRTPKGLARSSGFTEIE